MNQAKPICASLLLALGAVPVVAQYQLNQIWSIAPGQRTYITSGDLQRGIAYNPVTDSVLVVNRSGALSVNRVSASTGANLGTLNVTGITGGNGAVLNMIDVADDGTIYAVNLTTDSSVGTSPFKIYRWTSESAVPTVVYSGDISGGDSNAANRRFGDNFAVRGSGANTQFVVAARNGTIMHIFTTTDGNTFTPNRIATDITAGDFGLSVAFGETDTVWGTASGRPVRNVGYDLVNHIAGTHGNFGNAVIPTTVTAIAIDPVNQLLGAIQLNPSPTRDGLLLYQAWSDSAIGANDTDEQFPADNANANGTGAVDFDSAGHRVFALDSNNGLVAYSIAVPEPSTVALGLFGLGALVVGARRRNKA